MLLASFDKLRQAKRLSAEELESLIKSLTPQFIDRIDALRSLFSRSVLFSPPTGEPYDTALIRSALVSIVLSDVYPLNPYVRDREIENIAVACKLLGIKYDDVLEMTSNEQQIIAALNGL